ncbi:MAG: hypothetical protein IPO83_19325 [Chitinophagaceae bacterium]|nr:hypothetical protein [Chitinophagaceae bacterium]
MSLVYGPTSYTHNIGTNLIPFDNSFTWDGLSNIILEVRQDGVDLANNAITVFTAAADNKNIEAHTSTLSGTTTLQALVASATVIPTASTTRLNIVLAYSTLINNSYTWSPSGTLSSSTGTSVTATPSSTTTYTATATAAGCSSSGTSTVNVNSVTGVISGDATICTGSSTNLSIAVTGTGPWSGTLDDGTIFSGSSSPITVSVSPVSGHTYTIATLVDNGAVCTAQSGDKTGSAVIAIAPAVPVSVMLAADVNPVCAGTLVTFTATPTNGGAAPNYEFFLNTVSVQNGSSATYAYTPANNDSVTVVLTSNDPGCLTGNPATSNKVKMTVNPILPVSVVASTPSTSICASSSVTFTAAPTNGGGAPAYQWYLNGAPVSGETNSTYNTSAIVDQDSVWVVLTSNAACTSGNPATSNHLHMTVTGAITASITISTISPTTICSGTSVTFTSITTGGSGTYQWMKGGLPISGETNASYSTATLANGDVITCDFSATFACATLIQLLPIALP